MSGRPTNLVIVGQGAIVLAVVWKRIFGYFSLVCHFFSLSPSLWKTHDID